MQPFNEALIHFFNSYGGAAYETSIQIWELRDLERTPHLYGSMTNIMDINSLLANIEAICTKINIESNGSPIELVDKNSNKSITLQSSDARTFLVYRIEVTFIP